MEAKAMRCSACGALVGEQDVSCPYCRATLSRVACPGCFGLVPLNANHCPSCGASVATVAEEMVSHKGGMNCPQCKVAMEFSVVGGMNITTCGRCGGVWLDTEVFEKLSADREKRGMVMMGLGANIGSVAPETNITYRPCPVCGHLMNRFNYAKISGVILDLCKSHGVWFDRHELNQVLSFIEKGGLLKAQDREKMKFEEARREANSAIASMPMGAPIYDGDRGGKGRIEFTDIVDFLDGFVDFVKSKVKK